MSNTSTDMSLAPETWSVRPATAIESGFDTRDMATVVPSLEEDSGSALEDVKGFSLEDETGDSLEEESAELELLVTEELLSGAVTTNVISYFCPLTVTVSTAVPTGKPSCTKPSTATTSPDSLKLKNQIFHVSRLNDRTLLNVMVSNASPRATVCFRLPVTTTWFASLEEDSAELEDDSSELLDSISTLEEDASLLLDSIDELDEATLELLASEELLSSEEQLSMLDDDSAELELSSLLEDAIELEDHPTTVILPVAEALLSRPVTAIV